MIYKIPGVGDLELKTIILDLNGTLTVKGRIPDGIDDRIVALKNRGYRILFFTGNTRGNADKIASKLGIEWILAENGIAKRDEALKLEPETCVAIGNGLIDLELMKVVKLRIVTLQAEGVHTQTFLNSDIVIPTIINALDFLIEPEILIATLRS
ncbi:MAG: HAD hydrolase family protein [Candidatus Paceibacterota bacterium]